MLCFKNINSSTLIYIERFITKFLYSIRKTSIYSYLNLYYINIFKCKNTLNFMQAEPKVHTPINISSFFSHIPKTHTYLFIVYNKYPRNHIKTKKDVHLVLCCICSGSQINQCAHNKTYSFSTPLYLKLFVLQYTCARELYICIILYEL